MLEINVVDSSKKTIVGTEKTSDPYDLTIDVAAFHNLEKKFLDSIGLPAHESPAEASAELRGNSVIIQANNSVLGYIDEL